MYNNDQFEKFLRRTEANGLQLLSDNRKSPAVATTLEEIIQGETYQIDAPYLTAVKKEITWSKVEDKAMEDKTTLAVRDFVSERFKLPVEIFPTRTMYNDKDAIMEWDGIVICENKVFLLESKHNMTEVCIKELLSTTKSEIPVDLLITGSKNGPPKM